MALGHPQQLWLDGKIPEMKVIKFCAHLKIEAPLDWLFY